MKTYTPNSPETLARLLAMFMITDGNMDPREIESLENLHVYEILGLSRKRFMQILVDYCNDVSDEAEGDGTIHLIDKPRFDALLEDITERKQRILAAALAIDICKSDGAINEGEMALLRYMLDAWGISLDDIENEFVKP
ncbi:TerB family tellurite resistance protein [Crenobacter cavernae]|uniref:TerB family tellurite resistance protein n=1 Tax=Crenobacter cavernae TaxID=2290923 RepID=A0A345Y8T7_9NEIS|nr:TerB family tellurite resistance protein [Crenobacter cavernae]AXK40339.1 TerB family tellurite resistance protein [Crenobacter cavernae]RXZ42630.1 TerB family tellurite resistance protein [Crenobacter cavernae]